MRRFAHLGAALASASLAVSGLAVMTAPSAEALLPKNGTAKTAAGNWLAGQLTNGLFDGTCSFDCGNDIDAGLSLITLGGHTTQVNAMKTSLPTHVNDYIQGPSTGDFPDPGSTYAGPVAKSLVFAEVAGLTPTSYGGVNLVTRLEAQVQSNGALRDTSTFGDNANTLGQAFAVRGLAAAGSSKAASARDFLVGSQCSAGFFRLSVGTPPSCTAAGAANLDATAITVQQLSALTSPTQAVTDAITKARAWLRTVQNCDGSFGSGDDGENANSTGLAAIALGDSVASQEAARWLNRHQGASSIPKLAGEIGAVARNDADFAAGKAGGITSAKRDAWRRATAQAAPGLEGFSLAATPRIHLSAVSGFRKAGSTVYVAATGADAGTVLCRSASKAFATASGATFAVPLPAGTANRTIVVRDGYGNTATSQVKVLGAKKLTVTKNKAKVKKNKYLTVTVAGLQPGETGRIYFRGSFKASGPANSKGRFTHAFKVGKKKGKASIAGYGAFGDIRKGYNSVKVK